MEVLAIIIEEKPEGELKIETDRINSSESWITRAPTRFSKKTRVVTQYNYTCPYCLTPYNFPDQALSCREECSNRLKDLESNGLRNRRFTMSEAGSGRILSTPDGYTFLVGFRKKKSTRMLGPGQLMISQVTEHLE